jgi:DNA-binding response OmpR family regulator
VLSAGTIALDPARGLAFTGGAELTLAPKEFQLLRLLLENKGCVLSREALLVHIWGYEAEVSDRVIDNHIKKLRCALGTAARQLKTVVKSGYKLEE